MNRLDAVRRGEVVAELVRGARLREAARAAGVSRMTVDKLAHDLGAACARYQDARLRNLACRRLEWDAVWSFVHAAAPDPAGQGPRARCDVWTWVALDADTELVPAWRVGARDPQTARALVRDLAGRLRHAVRLATGPPRPGLEAVKAARGAELDDAALDDLYGLPPQPAPAGGDPAAPPLHTPRPGLDQLAAPPPEWPAMHAHAVALHVMHHNFLRMEPGRGTPAMMAGVADRPWTVEDLVALLEAEESLPSSRSRPRSQRANILTRGATRGRRLEDHQWWCPPATRSSCSRLSAGFGGSTRCASVADSSCTCSR